MQRRLAATALRGMLLLAAAVLGACAMVALAGTLWPLQVQLGLTGRGIIAVYVFCVLVAPGLTAGFMWGAGAGRAPRAAPVLGTLIGASALLVVAWGLVLIERHYTPLPFRLGVMRGVEALTLVVPNTWAAWLGILAGRRIRGRATPARLAAVGLVLAGLAAGGWYYRELLLPRYGIMRTAHRWAAAHTSDLSSAAIALDCFTADHLKHEFGAPPYAPKIREAFLQERAVMNPGGRAFFCLHGPMRFERVAGTRVRRASVQYHYNGADNLLGMSRWTWEVTFRPHGRGWLIAGMRLSGENPREAGLEFAEGPAGTVRILSAPEAWRAPYRPHPPNAQGQR